MKLAHLITRWSFPCDSTGKEFSCHVGDLRSIPGLGSSPGEGKGYLLQYSGLENSMDYSPWGCKELNTTEWLSLSLFFHLSQTIGREGYLSINTESNSININAHIPKQTGSTHKPLSLKEKEKKKRPEKERFCVKELNWNPRLVLASLPAVLKKKRKSEVRVHKSSIPHGGGFN